MSAKDFAIEHVGKKARFEYSNGTIMYGIIAGYNEEVNRVITIPEEKSLGWHKLGALKDDVTLIDAERYWFVHPDNIEII